MHAISRLDLSFAVLFQWRVTVGYIPENVVPMGTKSTIMENQLRTIYKIYDWFEVIRPDRRENGRIGKTLHVSEYFHLHHIRLIRSHSVIDLAQKTQRQNVCRGFCWIFFPCPLFCLTCCIRTHEKCQHTRGDRINIENGVEHEQTNHVSWAHMCSKQPRVCGGGGDNQSDNSGERSRFSILDICIATNREIGKCRVKTSIWNERENFVVGIVFVRISSTSVSETRQLPKRLRNRIIRQHDSSNSTFPLSDIALHFQRFVWLRIQTRIILQADTIPRAAQSPNFMWCRNIIIAIIESWYWWWC